MVQEDTAYKRLVSLSKISGANRVYPQPPFWASWSCAPTGWMAMLITKAGDANQNNFKCDSTPTKNLCILLHNTYIEGYINKVVH